MCNRSLCSHGQVHSNFQVCFSIHHLSSFTNECRCLRNSDGSTTSLIGNSGSSALDPALQLQCCPREIPRDQDHHVFGTMMREKLVAALKDQWGMAPCSYTYTALIIIISCPLWYWRWGSSENCLAEATRICSQKSPHNYKLAPWHVSSRPRLQLQETEGWPSLQASKALPLQKARSNVWQTNWWWGSLGLCQTFAWNWD